MTFAESEFKLQSQVSDSGASVGAHLRQARKALSNPHVRGFLKDPEKFEQELDTAENPVPFPIEMQGVWDRFFALHRARGSTGFSPNVIRHVDILAFYLLEGLSFDPWEVEVIRLLDECYLRVWNARSSSTQHRGKVRSS